MLKRFGILTGENMKFKYFFALVLLTTVILSLGTAAASENIDYNASSSDDTSSSITLQSQSVDSTLDASDDEVDLYVDMELGDIKRETFAIGSMTFEIPLIITVNTNNGTAKNVNVYHTIPDDFIYLSSDATAGSYDSESGIWHIGDMGSATSATLTILTKLEKSGTFFIFVNATTDSDDVDLTNNDLKSTITANTRISSNTTRTSADQGGASHGLRGNNHGPKVVKRDDQTSNNQNQESGNGENSNNNEGSNNGEGSNSNNGETNNNGEGSNSNNGQSNYNNNGASSNSNNRENENSGLTKSTESLTDAISDTLVSIRNIFNSNSSDYNLTPEVVKAISAQDYTRIPILIFIALLIIISGSVAYDKIKT